MKPAEADLWNEWLEADGLGGFASGTVGGFRTRRYHAMLLTARKPPTDRFVLVNGLEARVETERGQFALSTQNYIPDVFHPDGRDRLISFTQDPWPTWEWRLQDDTVIRQELFVPHGTSQVCLSWTIAEGSGSLRLIVRPLMSGRDYHALHHENPAFQFAPAYQGSAVIFRPYPDVPASVFHSNGHYAADPLWYRQFLYATERERSLDYVEDLASPGTFTWKLDPLHRAVLIIGASDAVPDSSWGHDPAESVFNRLSDVELSRRRQFPSPLHRAADAYLARRDKGTTIIAGYPWFTDWGRDTFIAMRGLCLATGRLNEAGDILAAWAETVSQGMLPNRFPDRGDHPEFNSVDASLWYIIAVHDYLQAMQAASKEVPVSRRTQLQNSIQSILQGYSQGTRFGIRSDDDGLLAAGEPGVQLTWMDAKVGDWVVTPRIGKPVEIQALWLNSLSLAGSFDSKWKAMFHKGVESFQKRFWNPSTNSLYDVVDVDHIKGKTDDSIRPNQIFAVGGLPIPLLQGPQARSVVNLVEAKLLTPLGLRTLSPGSTNYAAHYSGDVRQRDGAYHNGTVWPWLMAAFVDAWVHVQDSPKEAKGQARERFLPALENHLQHAGLGHVSEITDAEPPFTPRGCPFQAWSLGELLRLKLQILNSDSAA